MHVNLKRFMPLIFGLKKKIYKMQKYALDMLIMLNKLIMRKLVIKFKAELKSQRIFLIIHQHTRVEKSTVK